MPSRTQLLALLVVLATASVVGGVVVDAPPTVSIENDDDSAYRVTAFTVASPQEARLTNVGVTDENGERRLTTVARLAWPQPVENLSVADAGVPTRQVTVDPGEDRTFAVEAWEPGNVTVLLVEELGPDGGHRQTVVDTCTQRQQEISRTFESGGSSGSSICASSLDWLIP